MDDEPTAGEGADPAASGGETAAEETDTGDESAGDDPTGDEPAGDDPTGDDPAGDDPAGDESVGDEAVAETGDDVPREAAADSTEASGESDPDDEVPADVRKYERFTKMDGSQYDRVNEFLRDRTYITAREWAIARLCADFRTETGVEMTKIGENLPELVPFMTDTYTPQAVNQARDSFEGKVTKAGATFLYGAMSGFFTAEELDDLMYEVTEIAKFLLEVEGVDLAVADELDAEERISSVMRDVREQSAELRSEEVECPNCGHTHSLEESE
ncbi:MAG: DUF5806 family protein [Halonotius sp.]